MDAATALSSLETSVLSAARGKYSRSWADGGRKTFSDPFGRLYFLRSGAARIWRGAKPYDLKPGELMVIPAHTVSRYLCPGAMDLSWLHFTATVFGGADPFECLGWPLDVKLDHARSVARLWDRLLALCKAKDISSRLEADGILRQMLALFAAGGEIRSVGDALEISRFSLVFEYIDQHIGDRIRLAELSGLVNLQSTYFSNLFTRLTGVSPTRYIARRKIARAQGMLWNSDATLQVIASELGFSDEFHLSKVFKKVVGMSPSAYRSREHLELPD